MTEKHERLSGIELLKIISIGLIVISHVTQTLGQVNESINYQDYVILLGNASEDIQVIILNIFREVGFLGNNIFFCVQCMVFGW